MYTYSKGVMTIISVLHITTKLVNTPTENNLTALMYLLVNVLYMITIETIKLVIDVEQFGASGYLECPHPQYTETVPFFLFLHIFAKDIPCIPQKCLLIIFGL